MEALITRGIILHVIRDDIRCLLMGALFARGIILHVAHNGIDALFEGRSVSRSIFHGGSDLIRLHIQRACGLSIARRSLHAFPCFDREVSGVGAILIRYLKLIRFDAARGDEVARDVRIRRSVRF